jgi:hypothetical protein
VTYDDVNKMAREAGCIPYRRPEYWNDVQIFATPQVLFLFANLVAAHEREACVAIVLDNSDAEGICCTDDVLEAFRQRGEK